MRDGTVDANSVCKGSENGTAPLYFRVKSDWHLNYQFGFRFRHCDAIGSCSVNIYREVAWPSDELYEWRHTICREPNHTMLACFEGSR